MDIAFIVGSRNDLDLVEPGLELLRDWRIKHELKVLSAHRSPDDLISYIAHSEKTGVKVYIAAAGMAAHLAGVIASRTVRPVIGIPLQSKLLGLDSLLSMVQMPTGVPVATVAVNGATNAVLLAAQILALTNEDISKKLRQHREEMRHK